MQWLSYQAQGAAVPSQPELRKGRNGLSVQPEGLGYARVGMPSQQALAGMVPPLEDWKGADSPTYSRRIGKSREVYLHSQDLIHLGHILPSHFLSLSLSPSLSLSRFPLPAISLPFPASKHSM